MQDWTNKRGRIYWYDQYALNQQVSAFAKYDPDRIVNELLDTKADVVAVYATNQFSVAYYPSDILPQHPNLKGRDYFGDVCSRLQSSGVKVIAYINWLESMHPEWTLIPIDHIDNPEAYVRSLTYPLADWAVPTDPDKRVENMPGGRWRVPCINSPRRQQILAVTKEILEKYSPEMFHLDMFINNEICVCPYCMPALKKICGSEQISLDMIKQHWPEYISWRLESSASLMRELKVILDEHGVLNASNAMAPEFIPALQGPDQGWMPYIDVFLSECFDAFLVPGLDLNSTSIGVKFQHAAGLPPWVLRTAHPLQYAHAPLSEAQWKLYASACKANGAKFFGPCGVTAQADTTTRVKTHNSIRDAFEFYMKDSDLDENSQSVAKVALVFSWATRKYSGEPYNMDWMSDFYGWARYLIEDHIPFDVVIAEKCDISDVLHKYELLIMPDNQCLSSDFCNMVTEYIRNGGKLIADGKTSLRDIDGNPLADYMLGDVFGASIGESEYMHFAIDRPSEPEPAFGIFNEINSTAVTLAKRIDTDPAGPLEGGNDPLPVKSTTYPVATINKYGNGQAIYVAFPLGLFYDKHGDVQIFDWMSELFGNLMPNRQITVKAPKTVEVTCWEQKSPNRIIVHLANRTVPWTMPTMNRQISEIVPVHDLEISLDIPFSVSKVTARDAGIAYTISGNRLSVFIDKLDAYSAIILEG